MNISGMLCCCRKKLVVINSNDGGCAVLRCSNPKHESFYRIPIIPGITLPFPWETKRIKTYKCRVCGTEIDEDQAKSSFGIHGRALCGACADKI